MSTRARLLDLNHSQALEASVVGQKAATLAALRRLGEAVPDGLILLPADDLPQMASEAMRRWPGSTLVVRSSSPDEDHPERSNAGQFATVLDVRGEAALLEALTKVRASGNPRLRSPIPVLVMRQLAPRAAGVAFGIDPVTGRNETVIDATAGLAARLLDGKTAPERWIVRGDRVHSSAGQPCALTSREALEVAGLVRRVGRARGSASDLEWAIEDGRLWLLQARDVTALPVEPPLEVPASQTWIREDEHFARPLCPLEFDTLLPRMDAASGRVYAEIGFPVDRIEHRLFGGWPYVRTIPLMDRGKDSDRDFPAWLFGLAIRLLPSLRRRLRRAATVVDSDWSLRQASAWEGQLRPQLLEGTDHLEQRLRDPGLDDRALAGCVEHALELLGHACLHHVRMTSATLMEWGRLGLFCQTKLGWDDRRVGDLLQGFSRPSSQRGRALSELTACVARDPEAHALLDQPDRLLAQPGPGASAVRTFLDRYGRSLIGFELTRPTFAEDPRQLITLVARLSAREGVSRDVAIRAAAQDAAALARASLGAHSEAARQFDRNLDAARRVRSLGDESELDVLLVLGLLRWTALEIGRRAVDDGRLPDRDAVFMLTAVELEVLCHGRRFDREIQRRRGEMRWARAHPGPAQYGPTPAPMPPLRWTPAWARPFLEIMRWVMPRLSPPAPSQSPDQIQGIAASPGRASGPVRVLRDVGEFARVQAGEIVVCPSMSAAWSLVLPLVAGVVTERGGALSHPAILAREFGVPAVLNVAGVTNMFTDGEWITVDGTAGCVHRCP